MGRKVSQNIAWVRGVKHVDWALRRFYYSLTLR